MSSSYEYTAPDSKKFKVTVVLSSNDGENDTESLGKIIQAALEDFPCSCIVSRLAVTEVEDGN